MCPGRPTSPSGAPRRRRSRRSEPGQIAMMPPTLSILLELLDLGSVASVRQAAADRVVERVLPEADRDRRRVAVPLSQPGRGHDHHPAQPVPARWSAPRTPGR